MSDSNIRIGMSQDMKNSLLADAEYFEFFKKDDTINLNNFLNELIYNYHDIYCDQRNFYHAQIKQILLRSPGMTGTEAELLANQLQNMPKYKSPYGSNLQTHVVLTPNKKINRTINDIDKSTPDDISRPQYYRDFFSSYLSMPRNQRETIIFRQNFEKLADAIDNQTVITIDTNLASKKGSAGYEAYPYSLSVSKSESHYYFVCYLPLLKEVCSFRVSRIHSIKDNHTTFEMPPEAIVKLKHTAEKCAQFSFESAKECCVQLTEDGMRKYKAVWTNRPELIRHDGNKYYFNWPTNALENYFKRFGKDAIILYPEQSKKRMKKFYENAHKAYQE